MKALMLSKYEHLEVTDIPEPACPPDEVLIRVAACGICGSDVHGYDGGSGRRIPPIVMGHEGAGVIERVGAEVKDYKPGERVTFDSTVYCGHCEFCNGAKSISATTDRCSVFLVGTTGATAPSLNWSRFRHASSIPCPMNSLSKRPRCLRRCPSLCMPCASRR